MSKIHTIQYLRAVAALAVVALHAGARVEDALPGGIFALLKLGHAGVDLFFVISGFVMWGIARHGETDPGRFLLRRLIRVVPLYWIATLCWIALGAGLGLNWIAITPAHVLQSLAFVPHYSPSFPGRVWPVLVPGWTLNYEMFFYAVFAVTLFVAARYRLAALSTIFLALLAQGAVLPGDQAWVHTYGSPLVLEFLGGCFIAEFWQRRGVRGRLFPALLLLAGWLALICFGVSVDANDHWARVTGFGMPALLITLAAVGLSQGMPRFRLLDRLGDASYATYLFHLFLVQPLASLWGRLPSLHGPEMALAFIGLCLVSSAGLGLFLHRHLEGNLKRAFGGLLHTDLRGVRFARR